MENKKEICLDGVKEFIKTKNTLDLNKLHKVMEFIGHKWWIPGSSYDNMEIPDEQKISWRIDDLFKSCMKNLLQEKDLSDTSTEHTHYAQCGGFEVIVHYYPIKSSCEDTQFFIEIKYTISSK